MSILLLEAALTEANYLVESAKKKLDLARHSHDVAKNRQQEAYAELAKFYRDNGIWDSRSGLAINLERGTYQEALAASLPTMKYYDKGYGFRECHEVGVTFLQVLVPDEWWDPEDGTDSLSNIAFAHVTLTCLNLKELKNVESP